MYYDFSPSSRRKLINQFFIDYKLRIGSTAGIAFFAAVVVILMGGWQIKRSYDSVLADAKLSARTLTRSLSEHAARMIEGVDLVLSGAVERVEGNPDRERLTGFLERRVSHVAQILHIAVTDGNGAWMADTLPPHPDMDSKDREYFTWHRDHPTRNLYIGRPIVSDFSGKTTVPMSRRVNNADGTFAGIVFAALRPESLQAFYESVQIGQNGSVSLFSGDGQLLARYPSVPASVSATRSSNAAKFFGAPSGVSRANSPFDGIERIVAFEHVEGYPLIVAAAVSVDDALAAWRREASIEGLVLGIAAAVLAALGVGMEGLRRRALASANAARELNEHYRLLTENSTDLIALKPSFAGVRAYVSPSCRAIVGWEPDELAVLPNERFIHPEDLGRVTAEFAALTPENPRVTSLHRVRHKEGGFLWLDVVLTLTESGTPFPSVVVAARDVTARQEAQRALVESEARYRLLADASSDMIQRLDLTGRRQYVSPAALEIFGLDPGDMVGTHSLDFVHLEDSASMRHLIDDLAAGRRDQVRSIHRIRHKKGHDVWVEVQFRLVRDKANGTPVEIVSTLRDVTERETIQRQLGAANHSLRMAEEIAHVGHWRVDVASHVLTWSDEVYRIHGLDPATYTPTVETAIHSYHPDDRDEVTRYVARAVGEGRNYEFKRRVVRPDGEVRHVLSRGLCELDPQTGKPTALFGAIMDVTELAEAERNVREKSASLETTLDNMDQALIKVAADGTIELVNRRFAELLDIPAAVLDGPRPNFEDVLDHLARSADDKNADPTLRSHVAKRGAPFTLGTFEQSRPDGSVLEVRTVSAPDGAVVRTYADITARRQAEAAMREGEARYRVMAETANDVITRLGLDFKREYVSPACRRVLGFEPEEMMGKRPSASIHPDEADAVRALAARLAAGEIEGDRVVTTYRALHKDGHWVWLEAGMNLVRDEMTGAPVCLTCTLRDVTERQRAARHLERARATAEQAAMAKAEFLANMSHELRTPLTGMLGVHDLLRDAANLNEDQRRLVNLANEAGRSLLAIVNDVLDFSKIEAGQLAIESVPFTVRPLLEDCRALAYEGLSGKAVDVDLHFADDLPERLIGDPTRLRQIVLNLLTNAVKFTERGTIRVGALYDTSQGRLKVEVTDTGIGIPSEKLPMLFDRFSQADASTTRRYGGTGLGLAICKRLAELMSGRIGALSREGSGSTFWFDLPLRAYEGEISEEPATAGTLHEGRRVLLAEDNDINREIIATILSQRGYLVKTVADGAAAVDAVKTAGDFDMILMDLQMPVMDGLTATSIIRNIHRSGHAKPIAIIGLTANAMAEDIERCLAAGMDAHVAKPINWQDLFAAMDLLFCGPDVDEAPATAAADRPEVLNESALEALSQIIGRDRLAAMLRMFEQDLMRRLDALAVATTGSLVDQTHSLASISGQLGFTTLSRLCVAIEAEARLDRGLERVAELRQAVEHAAVAVRTSQFAEAA